MESLFQAGKRPALVGLILATLFSSAGAFGQVIRLRPIRTAPLGSPAGTIGTPVTPEPNAELGCWEYQIPAGGIEVHLGVQAFGWGNAAGSPTLSAILATVAPDGYVNGLGGELNPKGWAGSPGNGAYLTHVRCEAGGDLSPCSPPFDPTCDNLNNGECVAASNWVMPGCADGLPALDTNTLAYAWGATAQVDCNTDDGLLNTLGGLILEVPINAVGTYVIALDPDPNNSFMTSGAGTPIPGVTLTSACITVSAGAEIRFMPIRSAPLGSPVGTVGTPVAPSFNTDLGCWEYRASAAGIEVDLDLQVFGWGNAAGSPTLGAVQATVASGGYANGQGGDLNPKGWPGSPLDGAYLAKKRCEEGGDLSPCTPPFDPTCDSLNNGECVHASNWVMPESAIDFPAIAAHTLDYAWATAASAGAATDDGMVKTMGGLILEVPTNAAGTYVIAFNPAPDNSFMTAGTGFPIPDVVLTPACITIITGRCCSGIGAGTTTCEDGLTEDQCSNRPGPRFFIANRTCDGPTVDDDCDPCKNDSSCDDADGCTADICDTPPGENVGFCRNPPPLNYDPAVDCCDSNGFPGSNLTTIDDDSVCTIDICQADGDVIHTATYDEATECCDPVNGDLVTIDDGDACTIDTCNPTTGQVSHSANPDCVFDADAFPKNRYVSFETGVLTVNLAFHVRMTSSAQFPESVGDLGWVGTPDGNGIALVVPDPVFLPSWPAIVRAGDCEIVPASTYEIRSTGDGVNFDSPVVVETTGPPIDKFWGDIVGVFNGVAWTPPNGVQNFADVQAAIKSFQGLESTAPLTWSDVHPETPNRIANFNDVLLLILAFRGEPYPFSAPADCP